jgi:DNA-binding NarL/FixJ family response regulator
MPGAAPVDGIRRLRQIAPETPILVVTGSEDDEVLLALFRLGIGGFAPKTSRSALIEAAIRVILAGGRYLPPRVVEIADRHDALPDGYARQGLTPRLTDRQTAVLQQMAAGKSNKEIARALRLSLPTIKAHAAAAMAALACANRTEAVVRARELGLI